MGLMELSPWACPLRRKQLLLLPKRPERNGIFLSLKGLARFLPEGDAKTVTKGKLELNGIKAEKT
jgi:hypothetical protein